MNKSSKTFSVRILKTLLFIVFLLLTTHITLQFINWEIHEQQVGSIYELTNRFDLDDEASVPTWFSQLLFFGIGSLALLAAYLEKTEQRKRLWQIIGLGGIIASIDEVAGLHEYILQTIHNTFFRDQRPTEFSNAWFVLLPIILLLAGWLIYKTYKLLDKKTMLLFASAIVVFLIGAVGVDQITSLTERESFLHQGVLVAIEEALELVSTSLILYAILRYLEREHGALIARSLKTLQRK